MASIEDYKIKVISGINDVPLEPNYSGNGKGCNGAFYVERHNKLVDMLFLIKESLGINLITADINYNLSDERFLLEIGTPFLAPDESLELTYEIKENLDFNKYVPIARVYFGTDSENLSPASLPISQNDIWEYFATEYSTIPNIEYSVKTYYFKIQGNIDDILDFKTQSISLKWIPKAIFGVSTQDNIIDPYDSNLNIIDNSLGIPNSIIKPAASSQEYLYLFIPRNISEYPENLDLKNKQNDLSIPLTILAEDNLLTITSEGTGSYQHLYNIYRMTNSSVDQTEIIFIS